MRDVCLFIFVFLDVAHVYVGENVDDGSMTKDKREASLEKIRSSKSTRCILISFKAGSTGTSSPTHGERQFPTFTCSRFELDLL